MRIGPNIIGLEFAIFTNRASYPDYAKYCCYHRPERRLTRILHSAHWLAHLIRDLYLDGIDASTRVWRERGRRGITTELAREPSMFYFANMRMKQL